MNPGRAVECAGLSARREWLLLLVIVALGTTLRLQGLTTHSWWIDEGESYHLATAASTWTALGDTRHPPLFFWLLRGWVQVGGSGETWLRALPACLSCLALFAFAASSRLLLTRPFASLVATSMVAVSSFHVWHGQELRVYCLLDLGTNLALLGTALGVARGSRGWAALLIGIGAFASAGAHYLGTLIVPPIVVTLLLFRPPAWRLLASSSLIAVLLWIPAFAILIPKQLAAPLGYTANLTLRSLAETPVRHLITELKGLPDALRFAPYAITVLVFGGFASSLFAAVVARERAAQIAWLFFVVPIAAALALCAVGPSSFLPRYLMVAAPASVLVAATGLSRLIPRAAAVITSVAVIGLVASVTIAQKTSNLREDFRSACAAVSARWQPGDRLAVVTGTPRAFGEGAVRYYLRERVDILSSMVAPDTAEIPPVGRLHVIHRSAPYAAEGFRALRARVALTGPVVEGFRISYLVSDRN